MTDLTHAEDTTSSSVVESSPRSAATGHGSFVPHGAARFTVSGVVQTGRRRGRLLGFPTANLRSAAAQDAEGVWYGQVTVADGRTFPAAVSVGSRATFQDDTDDGVLLEAHLLDFDEDLYGVTVSVSLYKTIRPQRGYTRVDELIDQIGRDVDAVRRWAKEPERTEARPIPGWALMRAESAVRKQLALGNGVPDSRTLARLTGLGRHLAKRCLATMKV